MPSTEVILDWARARGAAQRHTSAASGKKCFILISYPESPPEEFRQSRERVPACLIPGHRGALSFDHPALAQRTRIGPVLCILCGLSRVSRLRYRAAVRVAGDGCDGW